MAYDYEKDILEWEAQHGDKKRINVMPKPKWLRTK